MRQGGVGVSCIPLVLILPRLSSRVVTMSVATPMWLEGVGGAGRQTLPGRGTTLAASLDTEPRAWCLAPSQPAWCVPAAHPPWGAGLPGGGQLFGTPGSRATRVHVITEQGWETGWAGTEGVGSSCWGGLPVTSSAFGGPQVVCGSESRPHPSTFGLSSCLSAGGVSMCVCVCVRAAGHAGLQSHSRRDLGRKQRYF